MKGKKSAGQELGKFVEEIIKAIVVGCRWAYENIIWVMAFMLFANAILFIPVPKGGIAITIINGIVLVFFGIRFWREQRN